MTTCYEACMYKYALQNYPCAGENGVHKPDYLELVDDWEAFNFFL